MSKLILNVSNKTYEVEEIKKFIEKEQDFRKMLQVSPFIEGLETWKILEFFPDDLNEAEDFSYIKLKSPIPQNWVNYLANFYFKEGQNYLQVTEEQRKEFVGLCEGKSGSYVIDKLYEGDVLVIQDDFLRYPKEWVGSINEFIAYGANVNKEYLINQYFEVLD